MDLTNPVTLEKKDIQKVIKYRNTYIQRWQLPCYYNSKSRRKHPAVRKLMNMANTGQQWDNLGAGTTRVLRDTANTQQGPSPHGILACMVRLTNPHILFIELFSVTKKPRMSDMVPPAGNSNYLGGWDRRISSRLTWITCGLKASLRNSVRPYLKIKKGNGVGI